ncbi:hypothetical protein BFAG_00453 [Bacteroides fragilis 3_1_12]|uniref:Uncharacterized protein n=1 Tax=Bacteroides fragilis 3_1_12 TaxID=457424 RepID=A0ABN0BFP6_BACFG|nr:hypothetical protein BFAG_00453 [Bacteroides fragilis 3_1_12]
MVLEGTSFIHHFGNGIADPHSTLPYERILGNKKSNHNQIYKPTVFTPPLSPGEKKERSLI